MVKLQIPVVSSRNMFSLAMMFLFRLAWVGRIRIPLLIASLELLFNLRVQLNINVDLA